MIWNPPFFIHIERIDLYKKLIFVVIDSPLGKIVLTLRYSAILESQAVQHDRQNTLRGPEVLFTPVVHTTPSF